MCTSNKVQTNKIRATVNNYKRMEFISSKEQLKFSVIFSSPTALFGFFWMPYQTQNLEKMHSIRMLLFISWLPRYVGCPLARDSLLSFFTARIKKGHPRLYLRGLNQHPSPIHTTLSILKSQHMHLFKSHTMYIYKNLHEIYEKYAHQEYNPHISAKIERKYQNDSFRLYIKSNKY